MAEISAEGKDKGKKRTKKVSTRIDMTPMVDLAFLLITFFMLTTTLKKPQAMELNMPDKNDKNVSQPVKESKAMTIILGEDDKVYWYMGMTDPKPKETDYSSAGIRKVIREKNAQVSEMVIIIKAMKKSKYKNMVDILDEMHITDSKRYAIMAITPVDIELTKKI
ncbi:MAG: ExbD/TolR family protein [Cytophagaceae bacterium]